MVVNRWLAVVPLFLAVCASTRADALYRTGFEAPEFSLGPVFPPADSHHQRLIGIGGWETFGYGSGNPDLFPILYDPTEAGFDVTTRPLGGVADQFLKMSGRIGYEANGYSGMYVGPNLEMFDPRFQDEDRTARGPRLNGVATVGVDVALGGAGRLAAVEHSATLNIRPWVNLTPLDPEWAGPDFLGSTDWMTIHADGRVSVEFERQTADVATVDPEVFNRIAIRLDTVRGRRDFLVNGEVVASYDLHLDWWQGYDYYLTDFAYGVLAMNTNWSESLDLSNGGGTYEAYFDNYSVDIQGSTRETPEPASLVLWAFGGLCAVGMAGFRRRCQGLRAILKG